jgi:sugar transferase (PEP-CTERM/EpsH1 system associated)
MKILFLTHRLPYAPNRGDRIRAYHMIRMLSREAEVSVASLAHDAEEASHAGELAAMAHGVWTARVPALSNRLRAIGDLATARPLTLSLLHSPRMSSLLRDVVREQRPDVVIAYCSSMARYAMAPPLAGIPFVFDMVDVDSEKWKDLAPSAPWPYRAIYRREARCLSAFERAAIRAARITLTVNEKEAAVLTRLVGDRAVHVVPNGIDVGAFAPPNGPAENAHVVFCGVLNYGPNEDAAVRLGREIWPLVRQQRPDARLFLVGADPSARVRQLATTAPGIIVTGSVPDVKPYLWNAQVAAVPLTVARGLQNKVLEALSAGLPTVLTPVVSAGLPAVAREGCAIASTNEEFAHVIVNWLALSGTERRAIAQRAHTESLGWERQLRDLPGIVAAAAADRFCGNSAHPGQIAHATAVSTATTPDAAR